MARRRLGEVLRERDAISATQLEEALHHQRRTKQRLGVVLIQKGFITEDALIQALCVSTGMSFVDLDRVQPDWAAIHAVKVNLCEDRLLFPFALENGGKTGRRVLQVAVTDPLDLPSLDTIEHATGLKTSAKLATPSAVRRAIARYYHKNPAAAATIGRGGSNQFHAGEELELEEVIEGEELENSGGFALQQGDELESLLNMPAPSREGEEARALARLLIRKGFITQAEWDAARGKK